jgi:hypothetical protein
MNETQLKLHLFLTNLLPQYQCIWILVLSLGSWSWTLIKTATHQRKKARNFRVPSCAVGLTTKRTENDDIGNTCTMYPWGTTNRKSVGTSVIMKFFVTFLGLIRELYLKTGTIGFFPFIFMWQSHSHFSRLQIIYASDALSPIVPWTDQRLLWLYNGRAGLLTDEWCDPRRKSGNLRDNLAHSMFNINTFCTQREGL